jgi:hypothetical protein
MSIFHAFYFVSFMGSTIEFGEIPYTFTDAQRMWVLVCIYFSVVAWLYAIARGIALAQDPAFRLPATCFNARWDASTIRSILYAATGSPLTLHQSRISLS